MSKDKIKRLTMRSWSEEDQPREKLLRHGRKALSDAELLAILIRSGSPGESGLSLSQKILSDFDHDLYALGKASLAELMAYKGIGEAKAITLIAAMELGRRRQITPIQKIETLDSSQKIYNYIGAKLKDLKHEEFWIILFKRGLKPIRDIRISSGGIDQVTVDIKIILKHALDHLATSIALVHNHPSTNLNPSQSDLKLTEKINSACRLLDLRLLDHLIISDRGYYSFADQGLI